MLFQLNKNNVPTNIVFFLYVNISYIMDEIKEYVKSVKNLYWSIQYVV